MSDYTTKIVLLQEGKNNTKQQNFIDPITLRKIYSQALSDAYFSIAVKKNDIRYKNKSDRVGVCYDAIYVGYDENGRGAVLKTNTCHDRLCPNCQKVLSLKKYAELSGAIDASEKNGSYSYIFLTLTVKNMPGEQLRNSIQNVLKAYNRFVKMPKFQKAVVGWYRSLEITQNKKTGEFHPHIHVLLQVSHEYFYKKSGLYISQDQFSLMWRNALTRQGLYVPDACIVDIRKVNREQVKNEMTKYIVKSMDVIDLENPKRATEKITILSDALFHVRFHACGGNIKKVEISETYKKERQERFNNNIELLKYNPNAFKYEVYKTEKQPFYCE